MFIYKTIKFKDLYGIMAQAINSIGLVLMLWFASQRKILETFSISAAVIVTLFTAGQTDISIVIIIAASVAATLSTLGLRLFYKGER